jgi:hypothetical protein
MQYLCHPVPAFTTPCGNNIPFLFSHKFRVLSRVRNWQGKVLLIMGFNLVAVDVRGSCT